MEISKETINNIRKEGFRPGVVGVFINEKKVLLLNKRAWRLWLFSQGGIDNNESILEALKREIGEEIGKDFVSSWNSEPEIILEDRIGFKEKLQNSRRLYLDDGKEVRMLGKHYYYCVVETNTQTIDISKTEFDNYKWLTYDEALKLSETIYQVNKKEALLKVLEILKEKELIN